MVERFVHATKGRAGQSGAKAFTTRGRPAPRITDALRVAVAGDIITVLDTATYAEGELLIDKPITLISARIQDKTPPRPETTSYQPGSLPRLTPKGGHTSRVLRIQMPKPNPSSSVLVRGFEIMGGRSINTPSDAAWGAGGGIAIVDHDAAVIQDCLISGNLTTGLAPGQYSTTDFRNTVIGRASDVLGQTIADQLKGPLKTRIPDSRPNHPLFGQCFGGGVAFAWSSARLENCGIVQNQANGRGGGVAIFGYGWPTIVNCLIRANKSGDQAFARRDGGGIGAEISVPDKLGRNLSEAELMTALTRWLANVSTVVLLAFLGASIIAALLNAARSGDWDKILDVILYQFVRCYLKSEKWNSWEKTQIEAAQKRSIQITNCQITSNTAFDDGGGIYCSVLSNLSMDGGVIAANNASTGGGGGIRMSMGSNLTLRSTSIRGNTSGGSRVGGGGIAVRNGMVSIIGKDDAVCEIDGNTSLRWAGGGCFLEATSEGAMAGISDMWHAILIDVFGFTRMDVTIGASCRVSTNRTGTEPSAACHGQGGGAYIIRGGFDDVAELHVEISDLQKAFNGNTALSRNLLGRPKQGNCNVVTKITDILGLVDLKNKLSDGDPDIGRHLGPRAKHPSGLATTFFYDS